MSDPVASDIWMSGPAIVIAAGGTGGHFFPAEALAAKLARRGRRVVLMTDARSAGLESPTFQDRERFVLRGAGVSGRGVGRAIGGLYELAAGTLQARHAFQGLNAAVVVGFGGYPAIAPVLGSRRLGWKPRVVLHEQNAVLGRANRLLARFADTLALSHQVTHKVPAGVKTALVGTPVRPAVAELAGTPYAAPEPEGDFRLLVLGGSQGARVFSQVVPAALAALPEALRARLRVVQQCRPEDLEAVRATYARAGIAAELASFFSDVAARMAAAHLVLSRAGASSVAELAVIGRPAVLVPLPGAIDDHQSANARTLEAAGGAYVIAQPNFTAPALTGQLAELLADPSGLPEAAQAAAARGIADAAARLADLVEQTVAQELAA